MKRLFSRAGQTKKGIVVALIACTMLLYCSFSICRAETGMASFYTRESCIKESGQYVMANGKELRDENLTCACWGVPFGTRLKVSRLDKEGKTLRSVVCVVTDRGPAKRLVKKGRIIDLSRRAFEILSEGKLDSGLLSVQVEEVL